MEKTNQQPDPVQMLQKHRDPYNWNNTDEPPIGTARSNKQRNPGGKRKHCELDGTRYIGKLGFALSQNKGTNINNINLDDRLEIKIIKKFPHLCSRLGKSINHIAKSTLKQDISPYQHKGRRVPLHLTEKVDKEIQQLLNTNQIIKLEKCSDQVFISPVVLTVKHDQSIKLALDSKLLNDAIDKNKYQMQSIDNIMD